ncbi:MAG: phage/plasmid primase, P4 family [Bdellovibrionales bacterium]
MGKETSIPAASLVPRFLLEEYTDLDAGQTLRYCDSKFYEWQEALYREVSSEFLKLQFTRWAEKFVKAKYKNTRQNAEEAIHHIKTKTVMGLGSSVNYLDKFTDKPELGLFRAFQNGLVNIDEMLKDPDHVNILSHTPKFFNLSKIPYDYDPFGSCPTWHQIIEKVVPSEEDQTLLQQWFGYHLISGLSKAKMMFLEGNGANGKSVVLLVLRLMLGEENVSSIPINGFDPDKVFKLAATYGKLANIVEEVGPITSRVEETIKLFVTGGAITVEKKFKDPFTLNPTAKLTFATNEFPTFNDRSSGLWRRILYIKFPVTILKNEQRLEFLERDFWLNNGELSGVLNWALEGAKSLNANGFLETDRKKNEVDMLNMNSDLLRPWVQDHFEADSNGKESTRRILDLFSEAIRNAHLPRLSQRDLFKEIQAQFPNSYRPPNAIQDKDGVRKRVVCGIRLSEDT